jgi:hypothetical protein
MRLSDAAATAEAGCRYGAPRGLVVAARDDASPVCTELRAAHPVSMAAKRARQAVLGARPELERLVVAAADQKSSIRRKMDRPHGACVRAQYATLALGGGQPQPLRWRERLPGSETPGGAPPWCPATRTPRDHSERSVPPHAPPPCGRCIATRAALV